MKMSVLILLLFIPLTLSKNITEEENIQLKKHCGKHFLHDPSNPETSTRILGGARAKQNEFPWIAAFYLMKGEFSFQIIQHSHHTLTLSILRREDVVVYKFQKACFDSCTMCGYEFAVFGEVLPSKHNIQQQKKSFFKLFIGSGCLNPEICKQYRANYTIRKQKKSFFKLFIGSGCLNPEICKQYHANYTIRKIIVHHRYDPCTQANNLAILEIAPNVSAKDGSPICMPKLNGTHLSFLTAVGFGIDPYSSPRPKDTQALSYLRYVKLSEMPLHSSKIIRMAAINRSICEGDFGGPLTYNNYSKNYTVEGIAFNVTPPCTDFETEEPRISLFTRVRYYLLWICRNTGVCPLANETSTWQIPDFKDVKPLNISDLSTTTYASN
ncbi:hypothetical protein DICVIV_10077 [Dictyocaulus viviparus]|uniref:Peptidase S1 domain-containing protein n=1 Tax=Dictyocaulus viviparus TaxID=29172 RepID=A0A0D8XJE6_DICVI|nr:hypothetical protein DICVIV_10077 [Dictyocaulus viviparus]